MTDLRADPQDRAAAPDQPVRPFRLVVVGAGRIGMVHVKALSESRLVQAAAVVEPRRDVRDALERADIRCFASFGQLADVLSTTELAQADGALADGALIAVPTDRHADLVHQAMSSGLPVLCEKPCGLNVAQTTACAELAARSTQLLQVAYWRRYVPELQRLRARILGGELGEILAIHCSQWDQAPPPAEFRHSSGGIFVDMGVHEFDQVRWLTGQEVLSVDAVVSLAPGDGPQDPDCGQVIGRLSGGGTMMVTLGRWHPAGDACRVEVFGTAGTAQCTFLQPENGQQVLEHALRAQAEGFALAVRGGQCDGATAGDAAAALTLAGQAVAQAGGGSW